MGHDEVSRLVQQAAEHAAAYLKTLDDRPVMARASFEDMVAAFGGPVPSGPTDPAHVIDRMAVEAEPGLTAMGSGRFFGFVIGGSVPAAQAADVLVGAWDQNVGSNDYTPAVSAMEYVAGRWVIELLGLPSTASVGWVTGGMMANFTGLAAGRLHVLAQHGWDINAQGLQGAPEVHVVVGDERHTTIDLALNYLGLGAGRSHQVPTNDQGVMNAEDLRATLAAVSSGAPLLVCLAAGNVNTGAFDPIGACIDVAHDFGAWVHVDGAFGLWAGASDAYRHLVDGVERGRLLGHGCAQVAQRAVRLWHRHHRARGRAPRRHVLPGVVRPHGACRDSRPFRARSRVQPAGSRCAELGGDRVIGSLGCL